MYLMFYVLTLKLTCSDRAKTVLEKYRQKHDINDFVGFEEIEQFPYPVRTESSRSFDALCKLLDLERMSQEYKAIANSTHSSALDIVGPTSCLKILQSTTLWQECYDDWMPNSDLLQTGHILDHITSASDTLRRAS